MIINIPDHYWFIGGVTSDAYQSKTNTMVPSTNGEFVEWSARMGGATPIASAQELADYLMANASLLPRWLLASQNFIQPAPATYDKDQLKAYSADARWRKHTGGIVVNGIPFPTDSLTLGGLNSAMLYTSDKQINEFSWKLPDGTFITLDTDGIKDLQSAVSEFGQRCYSCEDQTVTSIDSGAIDTLPQIDAAYAAVSNVFTSAVVQRRK